MQKTFLGPQLRRLRQERKETQGAMAKALGISTSYVNLLENNERSVSVGVLLRLFEVYGVDWRSIEKDDSAAQLADLRAALQDPMFTDRRPDLPQLRAALVHAPDLVAAFLRLHRAQSAALDRLSALTDTDALPKPEAAVHLIFRRNRNHFPSLETAAEAFWTAPPRDEVYTALKSRLREVHGVTTRLARVEDMPGTLRNYDADRREILLSEALDHPNRAFQLAHMCALLGHRDLLDSLTAEVDDQQAQARLRIELANYFAAAVLMPYAAFLAEARATKYDFDHLATRFGVSFEQACHRATTLQREGSQGVPFFFLRIDKGGNVTKRFNATEFPLAEYGGACPRLDVHTSFRTPGRIVPQYVEMPDGSRFFTFSRTVDRPTWARHAQDNRLAVAMGCASEHAGALGYAEALSQSAPVTPIGINCRICPRPACDQRAQPAMIQTAPPDVSRRGATRFDL
ncbi:short-chain fatty acyl-CoA regulator family protein [Rhodobacter sp. KR11]|uniref:helix-turn-helix domain-containing protein n=1 Tax=Rhodobacter sp. KR11 TaxID=2974588 RepID=UPI0022219946|nr:helix-turn-helix domain-containing protein [Rhodobacter sp. KR11]MCW1917330.1 short-chain fatty acyl-CoA regulator family protein [Rhodobacter sp. KR11]